MFTLSLNSGGEQRGEEKTTMEMVEVGKDRNLEAGRFTTVAPQAWEPHGLVPAPRNNTSTNHISSPTHFRQIAKHPMYVFLPHSVFQIFGVNII